MTRSAGTKSIVFAMTIYFASAVSGVPVAGQAPSLLSQTSEEAAAKSAGCQSCHTSSDEPTMHASKSVRLGCTDCHGGDASVRADNPQDAVAKARAHATPRLRGFWNTAANPIRAYTDWLREDADYIRFVNPGDLRVADQTCGPCHAPEVQHVRTSMMTHGAMLWSAALYNNGAFPLKDARFGESYGRDGTPQRIQTWPPPT
jgi:hypothetical protein